MTIEIPKENWHEFFNDLSKRRFGWTTRIEILDKDTGDQILADGLPLNGVTFEERSGKSVIALSIGETPDLHQTHAISNVVKVEYLDEGDFAGGVIAIEEKNEIRTLVSLLYPMPIYVGYKGYEIVMASSR
jgi:hypothetical protein